MMDNSIMDCLQLPDFIEKPYVDRYFTKNYVCLDFEIDTSHGDFGHPVHKDNSVLLACWSLGQDHPGYEEKGKVYSVWGNDYQQEILINHLEHAEMLIAQNAKYELGWLRRIGFDISNILVFCTQLAEHVLSGNLKMGYSLDECCRRRGWKSKDPVVDKMMKRGVNPVEIPRAWLLGRCKQDVGSTEALFLDQLRVLSNTNRLGLQYVRSQLSGPLADIECEGMQLDRELVIEEHAKETKAVEELSVKLQQLFGDINFNSDQQLSKLVYQDLEFKEKRDKKDKAIRTPGGKPKTDSDTLRTLEAKTAEQKEFVELYTAYNKSTQRLSKYLDFYLSVCNQQDGIFYASFNQTTTKTHRLSSSGMDIEFEGMFDAKGKQRSGGTQMQNQPNEYKRLFKAKREGWLFTEEDGSGLEFRVAGIIGNDSAIKEDINNPEFDPHRRSASVINAIPEEEVVYEQRRKAKAHTFKPLFGGQSGTKGEKRYYTSFNERYHELVATQEGWLMEALSTKRLILPWGMRFYYPYIRMDRSGYVNERTKVFNAPIQSFATAEIIPIQATILWHLVYASGNASEYIKLVNTVHDSVLAEVEESHMELYSRLVLESWERTYDWIEALYGMKLEGLPLGTEIAAGTHWGQASEENTNSYNVWQDGTIEAA